MKQLTLLWEEVPVKDSPLPENSSDSMTNEADLLSTNGGEDFRAFIEKITEIGYGVSWRILDAQYVRVPGFERAVPQRRRRVFVVGYLGDWSRSAQVLLEPSSVSGNIDSSSQKGQSIATVTQTSTGGDVNGARTEPTVVNQTLDEVSPSILANCGEKCFLGNQEAFSGKYFVYEKHNQEAYRISSDASNVMRSSNPNTGIKKADISPTLDTVDPSPSKAQGGIAIVTPPHVFKLRSGCEGGGKGYLGQDDMSFTLACNNDQYLMTSETYALAGNMIGRSDTAGPQGKGYRKETAFTLNSTDVQGVAQTRVRKLMPLECERLMGFPDNYTKVPFRGKSADECPDSPRYKACGNSMCVNVMRWIGMRIQAVENERGES